MALHRRSTGATGSLGLLTLTVLASSWLSVSTSQSLPLGRSALPAQPADHLVPPPLPIPQRLSHAGAGTPALPATTAPVSPPEPSGFMTRVARWFGLGQSTKDQQQSATNSLSYAYPKPVPGFPEAGGKPCSLCNKYPWVPMVGQQLNHQLQQNHHPQQQQQQHPPQHHPQQQQLQVQQQQLKHLPQQHATWQLQQPQPVAQASQQRQRAVQFLPSSVGAQGVFLPLAVPLPPLYSAQPFRPVPAGAGAAVHPVVSHKENVVAQSEERPVPVSLPTPAPPASTSSFEIVQSHQVTDFVTSVEYPATYVQSHAIDLGSTGGQEEVASEQPQDISTVRYQLEDLSSGQVHQHLPASQLLTEIGHFAETTTQQPPADNYPAASSQQQLQQEQEQEQEQSFYYAEQFQEETSTLVYSTTTELPTTTTTTAPPPPSPPSPVVELNNHLAGVQSHPLNYRQGIGRGRETPKRLLESPGGGGRPFTRDPADLGFRLSQVYTPTQPPTPTSTYGAIDASGQFAGMAPPSPQQVIIPYTTKQRPRPFESWTPSKGQQQLQHHQNHNDLEEEPHEQQESKLATATVTAPPLPPNSRRTTKYLTKILATNLRELLKRERETKKRLPGQGLGLGVDISRLQHNIDGWTEQEYNSLSHRPSTPTIRGRSKHIPSEYLTTTTTTPAPLAVTHHNHQNHQSPQQRQSKTTRGEGFELGGAPPTDAGDLSTSINNLEQLHLLGDRGSGGNGGGFQPIEDNRLHFDYYDVRPGARSTSAMTTSSSPSTTTTPPSITTTSTTIAPLYVRSTTAPKELWKQAQVAILPQTNEKVYVVTPQPRHQEHHEASASAPRPVYQTPAPRFPRMRPTPAGEVKSPTPTSSSQLRNYTPDIFGLMGLSSYVPAEPVEIIDGNSKVITIVTAAPTTAALQRPTARSTMSPSPR
ncbi:histone-lysine N-methyltransferase 2D [Drosophila subpulchrella]|uniref:histone-lysine N-methyltransferase 2D n=1 Tax=Drosophila subpulchrella TaxID=1486046 RepID=UPI0018A1791F|nr:histone-lysine N-methyltransferase 2D [Drosophila subpulchrella]